MLYRALAGTITPRQADDLEIWEIAVMLGVDAPETVSDTGMLTGRAGLRQRLERARAAGQMRGQLIVGDFPDATEESG